MQGPFLPDELSSVWQDVECCAIGGGDLRVAETLEGRALFLSPALLTQLQPLFPYTTGMSWKAVIIGDKSAGKKKGFISCLLLARFPGQSAG